MTHKKVTRYLAVVALTVAAAAVAVVSTTSASAAITATPSVRHIQKVGTAAYQPRPTGNSDVGSLSSEIPRAFGPEAQEGADAQAQSATAAPALNRSMGLQRGLHAAAGDATTTSGAATAVRPNAVVRNGPQLLASFDGMNHRDQRTANGGNQFSLEPPDQGLCVGNGHVVEVINDVSGCSTLTAPARPASLT